MSPSAPVLLALDTATDIAHAALSVGGVVRSLQLPGGAQASATLLPALAGLLREAGLAWPQLDAIAFGSGPGAFTGLRTACAVTQGLALGLGCPVIPLDTLMAVAEDARQADPGAWGPGDTIWVLQDARMSELYVGAFRWDGLAWQAQSAPQLWPLGEPVRRWVGEGVVAPSAGGMPTLRLAGNALQAYPEALASLLSAPGVWLAPQAQARGAALATLAEQAWGRGEGVDAALALPRYVRDKVAQTTAERTAAKAAAAAPLPRFVNRPMTEADIPALIAMERQACLHPSHAWTEDNYRSSLRAGYWAILRCEVLTGRVLAVCVAMDGVDEVHLLNIAVDQAWHGQGVARALLEALYARSVARRVPLIWLEVRPSNARALALYQRQGFVQVGVRKHYYPAPEGREDALVMRRDMPLGPAPEAAPESRHALD